MVSIMADERTLQLGRVISIHSLVGSTLHPRYYLSQYYSGQLWTHYLLDGNVRLFLNYTETIGITFKL